jgi:hypothetical protein
MTLEQIRQEIAATQAQLDQARADLGQLQATVGLLESKLAQLQTDLQAALAAQTGGIQHRRGPNQYTKLTPDGGTWSFTGKDRLISDLRPGGYVIEYQPGQNVSVTVRPGEITVVDTTAVAPSPAPQPQPRPRPILADLRSSMDNPTLASWLIQNPAEVARINASGVDLVAVMVDGVSLEAFRPGWKFNEAGFRAQVEPLLKMLKGPQLGIIFHTAAPGKPTDDAAWDVCVTELGKLFTVCNSLGIRFFFYDNEPYQTLSGGRLVPDNPEVLQQSREYGVPIQNQGGGRWNYWDFGAHLLFGKNPSDRVALARQFRKIVGRLGQANPGAHLYFYHDVAACDGAAPGWVNMGQAGNGFFGLAAMLVGSMEAVVSDRAEACVGGLNEAFASDVDGDGADIFARQLAYRKGAAGALNKIVPMSPALLSKWPSSFGFGAMRRYTDEATTQPADIAKNVRAILDTGVQAPVSGSGKPGFAVLGAYSESGLHWPDAAWAAFQAARS